MKLSLILAALGSIGIVACASPSAARGAAAAATLAKPTADVVRVEQTRVVAARIHPLVPVRATVEGDVISIRYGRGSRAGAVAHLSSGSLSPVAPEAQVEGEAPTLPSTEARRVALRGGRFVECFLVGSTERGFRLMAQEWSSRGSRLRATAVQRSSCAARMQEVVR